MRRQLIMPPAGDHCGVIGAVLSRSAHLLQEGRGVGVERERGWVVRQKLIMSLAGDHGGVVGAVFHIRAAEAHAVLIALSLQPFSQAGICGNAPGKGQHGEVCFTRGADGFDGQRVGDGPLE